MLQKIKRNHEPEVVDIFSDDDDDDCTLEERSETVEDQVDPENIQIDQSVDSGLKDEIEKSVKNTLDSLFRNVKGMIDGTIPVDNGSEAVRGNMTAKDLQAEEDALWQSFANLKQIISSLEFPVEILEDIVKTRNNESKGEDKNRKNVQSEKELVPLQVKESSFKKPSSSINPNTGIENTNPKPKQRANTAKLPRPASPKAKASKPLAPIRSDRSDRSNRSDKSDGSNGSNAPIGTVYRCPVKNYNGELCNFYATKEEMGQYKAAAHLNKSHGVTGPKMKAAPPGTYKFIKIKPEKK